MSLSAKINRTSRNPDVLATRLVDEAHMTWVAAEVDSEYALRDWFDAPAPQRTGTYLAYRASVEREEAAAHDLQRMSELYGRRL